MKLSNVLSTIMFAGMLFCSAAFALELDTAKDTGLVGEQENGYLGAIVDKADVLALITDINAKRKAKYMELASKNNITLEQVEKLAAQKAYQKTESGHYLRQDGEWIKK